MSHDLLAMAFDNSPRRSDPTLNQNIMNRAIEIGMDPYKDSKLFWIAEQSLKSKLPDEWYVCMNSISCCELSQWVFVSICLYWSMYVVLCYVMLCYVMLCYVMLCYVMLCCVM
jgi:hypothetical protein